MLISLLLPIPLHFEFRNAHLLSASATAMLVSSNNLLLYKTHSSLKDSLFCTIFPRSDDKFLRIYSNFFRMNRKLIAWTLIFGYGQNADKIFDSKPKQKKNSVWFANKCQLADSRIKIISHHCDWFRRQRARKIIYNANVFAWCKLSGVSVAQRLTSYYRD